MRSDAELGISDAVSQANEAMSQIAKLNQQLAGSSLNDSAAATMQDQRDNYINQLSQLMDIKVITGDHNQVSVYTNSGVQLVGTQAAHAWLRCARHRWRRMRCGPPIRQNVASARLR